MLVVNARVASDVIAFAASAGGLRAVGRVLAGLPPDFPAAILVVQHLHPRHPSYMAEILSRQTGLKVKQAVDHDLVCPAVVYVAPPNRHLLVDADRRIELTDSEPVHFVRPSADLLFESVAATFGRRAIGVVLSGSGTDGSLGVQAIKRMHGSVLVQDAPEFAGMPTAARNSGSADQVLNLEDIAGVLMSLVACRQAE